jgi:hypothetical protein
MRNDWLIWLHHFVNLFPTMTYTDVTLCGSACCWMSGMMPPTDSSDLILNFEFQTIFQTSTNLFCSSTFLFHFSDRLFTVSVNITRKFGLVYRLSCFSLCVWGAWGGEGSAAVGSESEISLTRIDLQFPGNPTRAVLNEHNRRFGSQ